MSEASIQVRRITNKVKKFYELFGFRHFTEFYNGRAVIKGSKRLGTDEIECVVSDTARGTSIGFYSINNLQSILYSMPFLFLLLLQILNQFEIFSDYISGSNNPFSINFHRLFLGAASTDFRFYISILIIASLPILTEYSIQTIRVANIKARFSFYSKNAVWETREAPNSLIVLQVIRSAFIHVYLLSIVFFAIFSFDNSTVDEILRLYQATEEDLLLATQTTFSITVGIIIGLVSSDKAIKLVKNAGNYDKRQRMSGGTLERRIEPVLFGMQSALYSSFVFALFLSSTFFNNAPFFISIQFMGFALLGGIIGGLIHQEEPIWFTSIYATVLFFASIIFIFRTGSNSEYAFLVILHLTLIPFPLIAHLSKQFRRVLLDEGIDSYDAMYDIIPILGIYSIINQRNRKKRVQEAYEAELEKDVDISDLSGKRIIISKDILRDTSYPAYRLARHYFELIVSYTASFDDEAFVIIPTTDQLLNWWKSESDNPITESHRNTVEFIDRLLWDVEYIPEVDQITQHENEAKEMVLLIK